jgi:hypothetical protein
MAGTSWKSRGPTAALKNAREAAFSRAKSEAREPGPEMSLDALESAAMPEILGCRSHLRVLRVSDGLNFLIFPKNYRDLVKTYPRYPQPPQLR